LHKIPLFQPFLFDKLENRLKEDITKGIEMRADTVFD